VGREDYVLGGAVKQITQPMPALQLFEMRVGPSSSLWVEVSTEQCAP
jgi:hypothetical protein